MAQKFGNARWVKEGYFDNRTEGVVVGQVTFAVFGVVDFCLLGDLTGEISGTVIQFCNPKFLDDSYAGEVLHDFSIPQLGKVSLFSFDPHPLLTAHPYFEWFSLDEQHYRIELEPSDAWVVKESERDQMTLLSQRIYDGLFPSLNASAP